MMHLYRRNVPWLGSFLLLLCLTCTALAQGQRYTLNGRVTDANGQGLPGVTVVVVGTTLGSASDENGNYSFGVSLPPGSYNLSFSYIGYGPVRQPLTLGNQTTITTNASLKEDVMNLDEVVATGSTIQTSRRELGNAISTIRADNLTQTGSGGLLNSLQGKVPGAQITQTSGDPSGGIAIRLRGIKSLTGSSDPLYVIDGVIVSNASTNVAQLAAGSQIGSANPSQNRLADLNPADIASINVLNGAAAAAQYGSRAANGVVIITTKRGQSGAPRVSFTTSANINELRKKVYITRYPKQFGFAGLRLHTIGAPTPAQIAANPGITTTPIIRDGVPTNLATNLVDVTRYDYFDEIFRTGYGTDNGISVSGGRDNTQYYVSFGYLYNQGIIKNTDFQRYSLRARIDQRLTNWAKMTAGLSYSNSFSNEKANGNVFYSPINSVNITNNIWDITQRDAAGNLQAVEPTRVNPLSTIEDMRSTQTTNRTIGDVQLNLTPVKGLAIDWILGVDTYSQVGQNYIRPYPYQATAGLPLERYPNGFAATANNQVLLLNSDVNVSYERQFSENFKLNAIVGFSYQYNQQDITIANGQNLAPFIETVSGAASTTVQATYTLDRYNLSGYFGQATFGFRNLAFLTAAVRRDRSSKFSPTETNQIYPKLSASFVVSDLDFWKNISFNNVWNGLKLRASYGESGNLSGIGTYSRFWQFSPTPFLGKNTIIPGGTLANPRVRPERMVEVEGGADLSFLNNRLNLTATVYHQRINDLVVNRVLAPSFGGTNIVNNVGEMENRGFELSLDAAAVRTKDWNWDVTLIYNRNRNKVLELGSPVINIPTAAGSIYLLKGQPAGVFYGTTYARNPDGSLLLTPQGFSQVERGTQTPGSVDYVVDHSGPDGQPKGTPVNAVIGNPNPKWTGSFASNVSFKRASLRVLLDAVQGADVYNSDKRTRQGVGIGEFVEKELKGELPRGYIFSIYNTEAWRIDDGSFVKLREVSLSYRFPQLIKGMNNFSVSLIGRNLISWDNYPGFDPETNAGGTSDLVRGLDFGNVPIPRTYQLQLSATF
ncbi:SusC/RagA family TonB-linked outer membrane protein [Larkinella soli]|uniref:SusC/RagA family TonB-linked outer membrane protein n=1 Tax=Larkinella soli TaxID=1770527 RepID=UPI000FFCBEF6|nr:SusC/RagA family TonB-linked outer membrane protein [Larkinella soli]